MNVSLKPFDFSQAVARAGLSISGMPLAAREAASVRPGSFQQALNGALGQVDTSMNDAARMQREVQLGSPGASLEQTMVAMQKAQLGFQATLQVRNKLVQAYSEVMNMQV